MKQRRRRKKANPDGEIPALANDSNEDFAAHIPKPQKNCIVL
jgi:hypothetical protein